jgi:hypothetical protein
MCAPCAAGQLDEGELRVAEEGEEQYRRLKVLRKIREAYVYRSTKKNDYLSLFLFSIFLVLYLMLLYSQMDAHTAYGVTATVGDWGCTKSPGYKISRTKFGLLLSNVSTTNLCMQAEPLRPGEQRFSTSERQHRRGPKSVR